MSSEPQSVRNGSKAGRPARMLDEDLQALVESLVDGKRMPTLNTIIAQAGGCQRSRAVAARTQVVERLARGEISETLRIPEEIERQHRLLLARWLRIAQQSAESTVGPWLEQAEQRASEAELAATDARGQLDESLRTVAALAAQLDEREAEVRHLTRQANKSATDLARWKSLATERGRLLKVFENRSQIPR